MFFVKYNDEYNARIIRNKISNRIQKLLWSELKMGNVSNGKPEYIKNLKHIEALAFTRAFFIGGKLNGSKTCKCAKGVY